MFLYGFWGFIVGMVLGAMINKRLLKHVPREQWLVNRDLKLRYGALNWAFGLLGLFIALLMVRYS
jgi:uncharacterized membrane-anchored protein YhcB (DUF1043 family)